MPFKALSDFFTNADSVRRMGEQAKEAARAQYDPSVLSPQLSMFRELATEGIEDEAAIARTGAIGQFFRPVDTALAGGNQGRALAMQQQQNQASMQGLANLESSLAQADIQARRQGQQGFAQAQTQQNQIRAQREAAIETADLQTQAEIDRRKGALGATVGNLAGTIAGSFLGPVGAAAGGALGGALFGGGQGALTGAATGATTAIQRDLFGTDTEETATTEAGTDTQMNPTDISNFLNMDFGGEQTSEGIGVEGLLDLDFSQFLDTDLSTAEPNVRTEQDVQRNIYGDMGAQPLFDVGQYKLRDFIQQGGEQFEETSYGVGGSYAPEESPQSARFGGVEEGTFEGIENILGYFPNAYKRLEAFMNQRFN